MKESLDFHIQEYNEKRVDKEQVLKYFHKDDRSKLLELVEKHKIKEFPAIKYHDGEYIYKISEDHWVTFTLQDLHKYQVQINGNSINLKGLNRLDQMLKLTEEALSKKSSFYYLNQLIGLPEAEAGGLFGVVVVGVVAVGFAAQYISDQYEPSFQEAKALGENYKRVKEIAKLCKANKEGLLANLNEGVNSDNSLIHHLLWRTQANR